MFGIEAADTDNNRQGDRKKSRLIIYVILIFISLIITSLYNFRLFHSITELVGVLITFSISVVAYYTYQLSEKNRLTFFGISYGFVCIFNSLHLFTYEGMGIFNANTANLGAYFSVVSKYMESLSLLLIPVIFLIKKDKAISPGVFIRFYSLITILIIINAFYLNNLHIEFVNGMQSTLFKKANEAVIAGILIVTLVALLLCKKMTQQEIRKYLLPFIAIKIVSQFFFMFYIRIDDIFNMTGHVIRLISFYCIYKALIDNNLKIPVDLLISNLKTAYAELENGASLLYESNRKLVQENFEREQTEKILRQSEERYRQLIEILPEGLFIHSNGIITYANAAGLKMAGVSDYNEIVGKPIFDFVPVYLQEALKRRIGGIYKDGSIAPLSEEKLIRPDGMTVDVEIVGAPLFYNDTKSVLVIVHDITERKKTEELKRNIYEQTLLLNKTIEIDKIKTEFFANISHEIRTPINVIFSALQLSSKYLENQIIIDNGNRLGKNFNIMNQNCLRLLKLVNNLIDMTKIDAGYMRPCMQNLNIIELVEGVTLSVAQYIESKGIYLIFDTEIEECVMACDPDKIERLILNLLSNSTKFTKPGGTISVNIFHYGDRMAISVKDTGIGIPEDKQGLIFERFRQVDQSLTRNYEGSGIGLSLVKSLAEMHEGTVRLESKAGRGSNFIIELPVKLLEYDETEDNNRHEIRQLRSERIKVEFSDI